MVVTASCCGNIFRWQGLKAGQNWRNDGWLNTRKLLRVTSLSAKVLSQVWRFTFYQTNAPIGYCSILLKQDSKEAFMLWKNGSQSSWASLAWFENCCTPVEPGLLERAGLVLTKSQTRCAKFWDIPWDEQLKMVALQQRSSNPFLKSRQQVMLVLGDWSRGPLLYSIDFRCE